MAKHAYSKKQLRRMQRRLNAETAKNNSMLLSFFKGLSILIFIALILLIIYIIYINFFAEPPNTETFATVQTMNIPDSKDENPIIQEHGENSIIHVSDIKPITDNINVNNFENIEITKLKINTQKDGIAKISSIVKNHSDMDLKDVNLRLYFLDDSKNTITYLDFNIDTISANGSKSTFAVIKGDLTNCTNYTVSLIK